jgi:hypothetical protein
MLIYVDGTYFAVLNTKFEVIPTFVERMIENRLSRLGVFPYLHLEDNGNIRITVRVPANAAYLEEVKKELEQIINYWR